MGIRISSWQLAREVSQKGELGVISGTVLDSVLVRELQQGKNNLFLSLPFFPFLSFSH
jgi:NAD(P)H-dependent flavin oxidoreductase YrpB (nitropropane dioxygenase family)